MLTDPAFQFISVNPLQPKKARSPMPVTPFPMMTDVKPVLPSKADLPMLVTPFIIFSVLS